MAFRLVLFGLVFVFVGIVIWGDFSVPRAPLGMLLCHRFLSLFLLFFSGVISYSLGPFMFVGFLPLVIAFYLVLFVLFAVQFQFQL